MVIWLFENRRFSDDAWVPFDRPNQKKLEYIYRHHDELVRLLTDNDNNNNNLTTKKNTIKIDDDEEDPSAFAQIQYKHNCISIVLEDSHFDEPITLYPHMLLGCLTDRDILIARADMMDHVALGK